MQVVRERSEEEEGEKRGSAESGGGQRLTGRDRDLLMWVHRHGAATPGQVSRRFFAHRQNAQRRLQMLLDARLLARQPVMYAEARWVLRTTARAISEVGTALPVPRLRPSDLRHTITVVDLSEELLAGNAGSSWITERELRAEAGPLTLAARARRFPDGVLVLADGRRAAVELELTPKRTDQYVELVHRYAGDRDYDLSWWITPTARVAERMRQVVESLGMGHRVDVRVWMRP